jgi:hypothetical protein
MCDCASNTDLDEMRQAIMYLAEFLHRHEQDGGADPHVLSSLMVISQYGTYSWEDRVIAQKNVKEG